MTWQKAADAVGLNRERAYRALHKPHVLAYRREQRAKLIDSIVDEGSASSSTS